MTWTVSLSDTAPPSGVDTLILGLSGNSDPLLLSALPLPDSVTAVLLRWVADVGMKTDRDTAKKFPAPDGLPAKNVVVVGIDDPNVTAEQARYAAGVAARACATSTTVAVNLPTPTPEHVDAIVEGALLGFHTPGKPKPADDQGLELTVVTRHTQHSTESAVTTADAVCWVRELVTTPPNLLYPETLVDQVRHRAKDTPVKVQVWDETQLREEGFGGILGVGGGSVRPPRLVALRYEPPTPIAHIALVGKGITFDSGGLSLKPANSMVGMKYDMTGAATVAAAVIAAARLGAPVTITGWLCIAENMPSGSALRPNDVLTIRGGKTVEVLNTDAEGRLVMADGLVRASEDQPDLIVDIATLTGAARVALGERYAAAMGHEGAVNIVRQCADTTGELIWPMPLARELRNLLDSDVADIANAKPGNSLGGSLLAGLFLEEFVGRRDPDDETSPRIPWVHVDIAGPASNSTGAYGYTPKGATGATTRTLVALMTRAGEDVSRLAGQ